MNQAPTIDVNEINFVVYHSTSHLGHRLDTESETSEKVCIRLRWIILRE